MKIKCIVMGGLGQVGSALVKILSRKFSVEVLDKNRVPKNLCDFLHVSIPWGEEFMLAVQEAIEAYEPKWVIIHSTVPVGTTRKMGINVVHSPVRGQHDDLEGSLRRFVKYLGCQTREAEREIKGHLKTAGFSVELMPSPESTELCKLLCLSRYLNDIAFYETAGKICQKYDVRKTLVNDWNKTYNFGYKGSKWVRPILDFPESMVGGHCVMPVSKILAEQTGDEWLKKNIALFEKE